MAETNDQEPQMKPRKRQARAAGLERDDDTEDPNSENIKFLKDLNMSLASENWDYDNIIKQLKEEKFEAQARFHTETEELRNNRNRLSAKVHALERKIDELEDNERELIAKLEKPLPGQEEIVAMVREDESLKTRRRLALNILLYAKERAQSTRTEYDVASKNWTKSIHYWQELKDKDNPHLELGVDGVEIGEKPKQWTMKQIFANREEELKDFRGHMERDEKHLSYCKGSLEDVEEERVKTWRDIVLGKIEEVERRTVELDPESEFKPDVQDEEDEDSGSDMPPSPAPVGEFEYDYSGV